MGEMKRAIAREVTTEQAETETFPHEEKDQEVR